jgi:hypothetical protein
MRYEMRLEGAVVCSWLEGGLRLVRGDSSWGGGFRLLHASGGVVSWVTGWSFLTSCGLEVVRVVDS